jgi:hypothetical protein
MAISDNNHPTSLTIDDWLSISRITVGCSKLVYNSYQYLEGSEYRQKGLAKASKKEIAFLSSFSNITRMVEKRTIFRPSNLRTKLPESVQEIQRADLTKILNVLQNYHIITKTEEKNIKKRGRPSKRSDSFHEEPGPKSYYQPTKNLGTLKKVIDKPEARKIIYSLLMESNLIYRYWKIKALSYLCVLKFGGKDKRIEINKATGQPTDEADLDNLYSTIRTLNDRELEAMAEEKAKSITKNIREDDQDLLRFYLWGGSYFYA